MARNPQENVQGAPTEGLGQTVTFAPKLGGNSPEAIGVNFGQSKQGATRAIGPGTDMFQPMAIPQLPKDPTITLLAGLADEALKADIEKTKIEKFVGGMTRAMQGASVADIAREQPWYADLFGPADAVEGARAYSASAKASSIASNMVDSMDKLREMGPTEAQNYFAKTVTDNLTGDKATDGAILQSMTRTLPSVMKLQAKHHYEYQQERAVAADAGQFEAGAARLQANGKELASDFIGPVDHAAAQDQFFYEQVPPPGVSQDNWRKGKEQQILLALQRGQLHAINAITRPGRNILDALEPDQRVRIEVARRASEQRLQLNYSMAWNDDYARILMMSTDVPTGKTAADIGVAVDVLNKRFNNETGASVGLIQPNERAALMQKGYAGIVAERKAELHRNEAAAKVASTAAEKAAVEASKELSLTKSIIDGTVGTLIGTSKEVTKEYADTGVTNLYIKLPPEERPQLLARLYRDQYVATPVAHRLDGEMGQAIVASGDAYAGSLKQAVAGWKQLHTVNPELAAAYYPKHGATLLLFDKLMTSGGYNELEAWKAARHPEPAREIKKTLLEVVTKQIGSGLRPESGRSMAQRAGRRAEPFVASLGEEGAAKMAMKLMLANNEMEAVGEHAWTQYDTKQIQLGRALQGESAPGKKDGIPTDHIADAFDEAAKFKLYGDDTTPGITKKSKEIHIFRAPDQPGGVQLFQLSTESGEKVWLTSDEIRTQYWTKRNRPSNIDVIPQPDIPGA